MWRLLRWAFGSVILAYVIAFFLPAVPPYGPPYTTALQWVGTALGFAHGFINIDLLIFLVEAYIGIIAVLTLAYAVVWITFFLSSL